MDQLAQHGFFYAVALWILLSSLGVVLSRRPLFSALWLVSALLGTAAVYALLEAHFLAVVQVMVYAGAIVVLMVFVLMLLGSRGEKYRWGAVLVGAAGALCGAALLWALMPLFGDAAVARTAPAAGDLGSAGAVGRALYGRFVFPFEAASLLILAALAGAVMVARRKR